MRKRDMSLFNVEYYPLVHIEINLRSINCVIRNTIHQINKDKAEDNKNVDICKKCRMGTYLCSNKFKNIENVSFVY